MLAANVCSADFIARAKHPALYRVHEGPTPEKKTLLQNYLKALGLGLSIGDDPTPAEYPGDRGGHQGRGPTRTQIHPMLLRSMQQAIYTPDQHRPLRPGLRGLHALHEPDPALSGPAGAPRHQGAARQASAIEPTLLDAGEAHTQAGAGWPRARQPAQDKARRRRRSATRRDAAGRSPARIAAPTSAAPTRPRATSRPGSSAATCASTSARSSAARSAR